MRGSIFLSLAICIALAGPLRAATNSDGHRNGHPQRAQLTVLFDAFGRDPTLRKDWGYAALIEVGGRRILFDTGNNPDVFAHNVKALGIDLETIDFAVMSHRHGDHIAGLSHLLSVNPGVRIFAPKESFGVFGAAQSATFYRRSAALPRDRRYFDGEPAETLRFGRAWPSANIELIDQTTEIAPGVHVIALVSDKPGTLEMKELSLAIETPEGIVLVVGCSHPGIGRIVEAARRINPRIHLIAGGFHLVAASDEEIARELARLRNDYDVAWIAAGHCTGEPTFAALARIFAERDLYAGVGTTISLGPNPRAEAPGRTRQTRSDGDIETYRAALRNTLIRFGGPPRERLDR